MSNILLPTEIVRLYRVWTSILDRCLKNTHKQYKNYGGRGISISEEWKDFNKFCEDVGLCPIEGYHLDRTDNDKGYCKENCRWVAPTVNHRNKRNNHYYETHLGRVCQSEFIEKIGYTKKQFNRAVEKHGIEKFIKLYEENKLPKKSVVPNLLDIIGSQVGNYKIVSLDPDKSTGARYFCICVCGKEMRVSRFNLLNNKSGGCRSCTRLGSRNPNSTERRIEKRELP
jgi:hypothetical protein